MKKNYPAAMYFITFACFLMAHLFFFGPSGKADDLFFQNALKSKGMFDFLAWRYESWSGRIVVEFFTVLLIKHVVIWAFLNSALIVSIIYGSLRLFGKQKDCNFIILTILLFSFMGYESFYWSIFWFTGSFNYLWPVACGLYAAKSLSGNINGINLVLYSLCLLIATNNEQVGIVITSLFILACIRDTAMKQFNLSRFILMIVSLCAFMFVLLSPGSSARYSTEVTNWFPDYGSYNIAGKLLLGVVNFSEKVSFVSTGFIITLSFLVSCIWYFRRKPILLIASLISFTLFTYASSICSKTTIPQSIYSFIQSGDLSLLIKIAIAWAVILQSLLIFFLGTINNPKLILIYSLPIAGILSSIILGFTPTVYASGVRVFFLCYTCFMIFIIFSCTKQARRGP
ncbi:DUF6056 family protein [Escherichia coli]|uniref:DUF6056 family protein n=1 Tax=Escherichia coli TaxID=562 RepID=UPI0029441A1A|nr:hypothetical protein [Escherichia coli]HED4183515.1 hypothetical protein [Enterobacter mori]